MSFPQTGGADLTAWVTNFFFATLHVISSPRGPDAFESTKVENGTSWSRMLPVPGLWWRNPLSKHSKLFDFFVLGPSLSLLRQQKNKCLNPE